MGTFFSNVPKIANVPTVGVNVPIPQFEEVQTLRRIPLSAGSRRKRIEDGTFVFALLDPFYGQSVEHPIPFRGERFAQPGLLRACRPIAKHVLHQVTIFTELGKVADPLRHCAEFVPPGAGESPPQLAIAVGSRVEFVQVSQEAGNSGDVQYAAHDLRPFLEGPQARFVQWLSRRDPGLNQRERGMYERRTI